jgi:hypothetical protein
MSIRVEARIGIQSTAQHVWDVVSDFKSWDEWNPTYPQVSGAIGFGERLVWLERLPGKPERRVTLRVVDWTPGTQLVMRAEEGFMTHRLQYLEIDKLADVGCILAVGCYFKGWFEEAPAKRLGPAMKQGFTAMVEAAKARAEAGA